MVEIEMKKSKKLKYIYSGEKLILIGDFSSSPYQIIEDNTNPKRDSICTLSRSTIS